ncbi:MAG: DUF4139 domain-containing protein [Bacteroidetes bacterium]|nr:DUF4139 domain-containing protein [Bacteroidota bacterium]
MKYKFSVLIAFLWLAAFTVSAGNIERFTPAVSSIKVYLNAAQITHTQQLTIKKGDNKFLFCSLASCIEPRNLILEKLGSAKLFKLSLIAINDSIDIFSLEPEIVQLLGAKKDTLMVLERRIQKLRAEIEGLEIQKRAIIKNGNPVAIEMNNQILSVNPNLLMDTYASISTTLIDKKKELKDVMRDKRYCLLTVFGINKTFSYSSQINIIFAIISNDGDEYTTELSLSYLTTEAAWNPFYEVVALDNASLKLNYNAKVLNNSGLNWNNTAITLSTADPFNYYRAPFLSPVYVGKYRTTINNQNDRNNTPINGYRDIKVPDREINFKVAGLYKLLTNPEPYQINICEYELHPVLAYRTVPKKDANVYMVARIADWEKLDLIDGEASIFSNGQYLGKTIISASETEDSLEIPLGIVKNIIVNYKLLGEYSSKKILGGDIVSTYSYEMKIKNNDNTKISLEILDQIPVSEESAIKTEINEITDGADRDLQTGLIVWRKEIKATSECSFTFKYSVSYPRRGGYGIPKGNYRYRNARFL